MEQQAPLSASFWSEPNQSHCVGASIVAAEPVVTLPGADRTEIRSTSGYSCVVPPHTAFTVTRRNAVFSFCEKVAPSPQTNFCDRYRLAKLSASLLLKSTRTQPPKGNMIKSPKTTAERRLDIARRLHQALVAQNPDRAITLCDGDGRVLIFHDPRPERGNSGLPLSCSEGDRSGAGDAADLWPASPSVDPR
jgi:hypothetical protein